MKSRAFNSRGFTLVASLMLLLLMSALALGVMMMVGTEVRAGGNDAQNSLAYHQSEGGIERMCSDLANLYRNIQSPSINDYNSITAPTDDPTVTYTEYKAIPHTKVDVNGNTVLDTDWGQISTGAFANLWAQITKLDLKVTATRNSIGQEQASMMRTVEVAMIPVFQFGAFSDMDLALFTSPKLDFEGRLHTNGNLFLGAAGGATVTFHDKITAYGEVIRTVTPNNLPANSTTNDDGTVRIPNQSKGCDGTNPSSTTCIAMGQSPSQGSVRGTTLTSLVYNGTPTYSPDWQNDISKGTYKSWITNGNWGGAKGTGVQRLTLPFVGGGAQPFEIIRRPPPTGETPTSPTGASREYNMAEIQILLADDPNDLSAAGANDPDNVPLRNIDNSATGTGAGGDDNSNGVKIFGTNYRTFFAEGSYAIPYPGGQTGALSQLPADWQYRPDKDATLGLATPLNPVLTGPSGAYAQPGAIGGAGGGSICVQTKTATPCAYPYFQPANVNVNTWNLLNGYIRVVYFDSNRTPHPVTREWLSLGFARGVEAPKPSAPNPVHPNAILILQKIADRNMDGTYDDVGKPSKCTSSSSGNCTAWSPKYSTPPEVVKDPVTLTDWYTPSAAPTTDTKNNWYPINFYDPREGEWRDVPQNDNSCTAMGLMNAVELDVGNLKRWLSGSIAGTSGASVDNKAYNGYILYFSDRRGMRQNPNGTLLGNNTKNTRTGDSGLEDVITTDNALETPGGAQSPEDVNLNGQLDNWGRTNLGLGFYDNTTSVNGQITGAGGVYYRISSVTANSGSLNPCMVAGKTWVSGARHVLKLVDGGYNGNTGETNLPRPGFTVASENPVYIQGDYNSYANDGTWTDPYDVSDENTTHSAASVIGDAVTLLSNSWVDRLSLLYPAAKNGTNPPATRRGATSTYYRTAIAAGKNRTFQAKYAAGDTNWSYGTDGGLHNFLRFLEDWSNDSLNYKGSMVSLYYSTYATGIFKCCGYTVYEPPTRNYVFDLLFQDPSGLPPGTPMFKDVEKSSYTQYFTARSD